MALNPLKVFVFIVGGTVAAAGTAFYSGAMKSESRVSPQATGTEQAGNTSVAASTSPAASGPQVAGGKADKPETEASAGTTPPDMRLSASAGVETSGTNAGGPVQSGSPQGTGQAVTTAPADGEGAGTAPQKEASLTPPEQNGTKPAQAPATLPPDAGASKPAADDGTPTFDVVRVEPDGSMVVAGHAAEKAKVDLVAGGKVLGSTAAGDDGDFAIVLDEPLPPGEHQIQLSGTSADGTTETSTQTAVVSVPRDKDGQVLAMVEEPGAPSRLLTVPEAPAAASRTEPAAAAANPSDAGAKGAQIASTVAPKNSPIATAPSQAPASGVAATDKPASAPLATASAENPSSGAAAPASTGAETAGQQQASAQPPTSSSAAKPAEAAAPSVVSVQAVEIEGTKIYVAGRAPPGSTVRIYANDVLLGDAKTSAGGQFLIETVHDLAVGTYTVRADVLNAGGTVVARAEVPFEREAGESVAAVAPELQKQADAGAAQAKTAVAEAPALVAGEPKTAGTDAAETAAGTATNAAPAVTPSKPVETAVAAASAGPAGTIAPAVPEPAARAAKPTAIGPAPAPSSAKGTGEAASNSDTRATVSSNLPKGTADAGTATVTGTEATAANAGSAPQQQQASLTPLRQNETTPAQVPAAALTEAEPVPPKMPTSPAAGRQDTAVAMAEPEISAAPEGANAATGASGQAASDGGGVPNQAGAAQSAATGAGATPSLAAAMPAAGGLTDAANLPLGATSTAASLGEQASAALTGAGSGAGREPVTAIAPKLQNVDAAIIIRRGDSLWRISRRVYGFGTRYSTIYLANSDQIRDPDLIMPGQVFAVPARSQQGETADLDAMQGQMTVKSGEVAPAATSN